MAQNTEPLGWIWATVSQRISPTPCLLWGVVSTFSGVGSVTIRDGHNTDDPAILNIVGSSSTNNLILQRPLRTKKGLFCQVGTNVSGVLVLWEPLE